MPYMECLGNVKGLAKRFEMARWMGVDDVLYAYPRMAIEDL